MTAQSSLFGGKQPSTRAFQKDSITRLKKEKTEYERIYTFELKEVQSEFNPRLSERVMKATRKVKSLFRDINKLTPREYDSLYVQIVQYGGITRDLDKVKGKAPKTVLKLLKRIQRACVNPVYNIVLCEMLGI